MKRTIKAEGDKLRKGQTAGSIIKLAVVAM